GANLVTTTSATNFTVNNLSPSTAYTFTVRARDAAVNVSPPSNALNVTTDNLPIQTIVRFEAETNFVVLTDADNDVISNNNGDATAYSNGLSVRLPDIGDKIRINFMVANAGQYIIRARVRSGNATNSTIYWPDKYVFELNGAVINLVGDNNSISVNSVALGGSFYGSMQSTVLSLNQGANFLNIQAVLRNWGVVDYIEIESTGNNMSVANKINLKLTPTDGSLNKIELRSLYPNPIVHHKIHLSFSNELTGDVNYQIIDQTGKLLIDKTSQAINSSIWELNIPELEGKSGVFILKIQGENLQPKVIRLIKE
ncbi:MAG: T9SS type A sorting domain-containing protein, partial [Microscillaceae bacterium]|nr:T9SS type A sorting domain-containing protein [Microscillaceae bacterium]